MSDQAMWSVEEITHQAYDVFLDMAPNHLTQADIDLFNEHREEHGFIEDNAPSEQWAERVAFEIEPESYTEITVGLEWDTHDEIFAQILISRDKHAPFCHIVWLRETPES